jgi:hypothetical protein
MRIRTSDPAVRRPHYLTPIRGRTVFGEPQGTPAERVHSQGVYHENSALKYTCDLASPRALYRFSNMLLPPAYVFRHSE